MGRGQLGGAAEGDVIGDGLHDRGDGGGAVGAVGGVGLGRGHREPQAQFEELVDEEERRHAQTRLEEGGQPRPHGHGGGCGPPMGRRVFSPADGQTTAAGQPLAPAVLLSTARSALPT